MERFLDGPSRSSKVRFKSVPEQQIALLFQRQKIPYKYEHPLAVIDRGYVRLYYPDFQLPQFGIVIEYFGLNGKPDYDRQASHKKQVYSRNGIDAIFLDESDFKGCWPERIVSRIGSCLKHRVDRFYSRNNDLNNPF